jgi:hypothetical protein
MSLPPHGRVACSLCHVGQCSGFDQTVTTEGDWRLTHNPLAWGNPEAEVAVLGFSKGPTQRGALTRSPHDEIAFKGGRTALARILHHLGLVDRPESGVVDRAISDRNGRFHFGSLIRCTVERYDQKATEWMGTGGGMLDKFTKTPFGRQVLSNCIGAHLTGLSPRTKLVVMLGMGAGGNYVEECRRAFVASRPQATWRQINEVAYSDGQLTVVHTEHFKSQGALLPNWLSGDGHPRGKLGLMAREAAKKAVGNAL